MMAIGVPRPVSKHSVERESLGKSSLDVMEMQAERSQGIEAQPLRTGLDLCYRRKPVHGQLYAIITSGYKLQMEDTHSSCTFTDDCDILWVTYSRIRFVSP